MCNITVFAVQDGWLDRWMNMTDYILFTPMKEKMSFLSLTFVEQPEIVYNEAELS